MSRVKGLQRTPTHLPTCTFSRHDFGDIWQTLPRKLQKERPRHHHPTISNALSPSLYSETPPPTSAISVCSVGCSDELKGVVIQTVFRLMGPAQQGHTNTFFKFQSSKFVSDIEKAWPGVPWIYLFRDPLEVMASNLKVRALSRAYRV